MTAQHLFRAIQETGQSGTPGATILCRGIVARAQRYEAQQGKDPTLQALDALYGVCENLYGVCSELLDSKDARLVEAGKALSKAQEVIQEMNDLDR